MSNLLQQLYKAGKLDEKKLNEVQEEIKKSGKTEEEVILANRIVSENDLFKVKSDLTKTPLLKPDLDEIPLDVLDLISEEAAINYKMTPLFKKDNVVGIGMVYPEDIMAKNALRFLSQKGNFKYEIYLITFSDLNNILKQHRNLKSETKKALTEFSKEKKDILTALNKGLSSVETTSEAPIIKMVLVILRHSIEGNASDIHIEPGRDKLNVRFRQDGILHLSLFLPLNVHSSIVSRIKILANLKIDASRIAQDGRFSATINNKKIY